MGDFSSFGIQPRNLNEVGGWGIYNYYALLTCDTTYPSRYIIQLTRCGIDKFNDNNVIDTYKLIHKQIHKHSFIATYICDSNTFIIQTFNIVSNVETHLGKTTKVLFIWNEKYMEPLVCALRCILCSRYLFLIYT